MRTQGEASCAPEEEEDEAEPLAWTQKIQDFTNSLCSLVWSLSLSLCLSFLSVCVLVVVLVLVPVLHLQLVPFMSCQIMKILAWLFAPPRACLVASNHIFSTDRAPPICMFFHLESHQPLSSNRKLLQCGHENDIVTPPCPPLARRCVANNLYFLS